MEGNRPIEAPPGPPTPWPPHYPPANQARRWLPVAIIVAAIIIATAVISAVLLSRDTNTAAPAAPAPTQIGSPAQAGTTDTSSTCDAWPSTKAALNAIPALPAGWNWDTPNIDMYVANQNAAVTAALDLFEPEIAGTDPQPIADAANTYVSVRRQGMQKLADHTYTQADGVPITAARAKLDQLCGVR
ncbi:hypothetical protein [Mycolicibacterium nivoides]|uniref:DUF732 domain-containing protein n=1 Tax=Mycolicibacterium nivoides TaxID=2487344 RepID=A0ABW9LL15_9MYCO